MLDAIPLIDKFKPNKIITDLKMPNKTGLELVEYLNQNKIKANIIILTGYGSIASATKAIKLGAIDYLTKPVDLDQILEAFNEQLETPKDPHAKMHPSLERVEWEHIQRTLHDCNGNISKAARLLGLHRRTLQRKLAIKPVEN